MPSPHEVRERVAKRLSEMNAELDPIAIEARAFLSSFYMMRNVRFAPDLRLAYLPRDVQLHAARLVADQHLEKYIDMIDPTILGVGYGE